MTATMLRSDDSFGNLRMRIAVPEGDEETDHRKRKDSRKSTDRNASGSKVAITLRRDEQWTWPAQ